MKKHSPRHGSLQYWPRKRAKKEVPRIRKWANLDTAGLLAFAGYKVGMTRLFIIDSGKHSPTKGQELAVPVTILEVPSINIIGVRFYKSNAIRNYVYKDILLSSDDSLSRRLDLPKKDFLNQKVAEFNALEKQVEDFSDIRVLVSTSPYLTGIGKKTPEIIEFGLGGSVKDKYDFVKAHIGKPISFSDVFEPGTLVDSHSVTKGYGFQGPVRRFGIGFKPHKSEKGVRRPGSLGAWTPERVTYETPMAGQTGYHLRTEYNKQILAYYEDPSVIQKAGGFKHYGVLKNPVVLIKGSIGGPSKRLIVLTYSIRSPGVKEEVPEITEVLK